MTRSDRALLHQLHPLKLAVDWGTAAVAGVLFWRAQSPAAIVVGFIPSIATTLLFLSGRFDRALDRIRRRGGAHALAEQLSADVNAIRLGGLASVWAGCGGHQAWAIPAGGGVSAAGWRLARRRAASSEPGSASVTAHPSATHRFDRRG